jgi:phospholipid N-methyltransferase
VTKNRLGLQEVLPPPSGSDSLGGKREDIDLGLKDLRLFLSEMRTHWHTTGAIAPSSSALASAMMAPLRSRADASIRVLEVGAGTGSFTREIFRHLRAGDALDVYELNPQFSSHLDSLLQKMTQEKKGIRCRLFNADIRDLPRAVPYDFIVSGLPFNNFDSKTVEEILEIYIDRLTPEGTLSYFEYPILPQIKMQFLAPAQRREVQKTRMTVRLFLENYQFHSSRVWRNLPPAIARHCRKPIGG